MGEAVLVAIISGCISLIGTILTILATSKKQAVSFAVKRTLSVLLSNASSESIARSILE